MIYIYYLLIAAAIFIIYARIEATLVKVERLDISKQRPKNITQSSTPIKIAHISDIHIKKLKVPLKKIKQILNEEEPDIILLSGDYIERQEDIGDFMAFLKTLPKKPTYACLGNHDYRAFLDNPKELKGFIKTLNSQGVEVLNNSLRAININGLLINIIGIADMKYKKHNVPAAFMNLNCDTNETYATVAFSHNPDIVFQVPKNKTDILLCGHFHGGQIWAPFHFEFKLLRKERLSKMKVFKGLNNINGIQLYINRGLGNVIVPLRFLSKPEILILTI